MSPRPFTEKDFDKYFEKIFSQKFIKALLKIKSEVLDKKGSAETISLKDGNTSYRIYATFDKEEKCLRLNLASITVEKDEHGEILPGGEFSIIYQFDIIDNKEIKLKQVMLAG
jgi:hypothetical protein